MCPKNRPTFSEFGTILFISIICCDYWILVALIEFSISNILDRGSKVCTHVVGILPQDSLRRSYLKKAITFVPSLSNAVIAESRVNP